VIAITAIAISLGSYHFNRDYEHNEVNPGVFVELDHDFVVGVYRNSHWKTTALVAGRWTLVQSGSVNLGLLAGVCTGYRSPVCGSLVVGVGPVTLAFVPKVGSESSAVVGLSWRHQL
jgi:hypothetical protein